MFLTLERTARPMAIEESSRTRRALEDSIGYHFGDRSLLQHALTHRSYVPEASAECPHNERFEFLGDSVLGFIVSKSLMDRFPFYTEGQLTKLKAFLVSAAHLVEASRRLGLGDSLRLGKGEERSGGRDKKALLVDGLEAVIAAIYLDGGLDAARRFIESHVLTDQAVREADDNLALDNFKSALQELLQARKLPTPRYQIVSQSGPPHRRTFTIELSIGKLFSATAQSSTRKAAEQETARQALEFFCPVPADEVERNGPPATPVE